MVMSFPSTSSFDTFQVREPIATVPPVAFSSSAITRCRTISLNAGLCKNQPRATTRTKNSPAITTQNHHGKRDTRTFVFSVMLLRISS